MTGNFNINQHLLQFFLRRNQLSAFRVFTYIQRRLNNNLHLSDHDKICEDLKISKQVFYRALRKLKEFKACTKISKTYTRFHAWRKWRPIDRNRITEITLENLRDLKFLRALGYLQLYFRARNCARMNARKGLQSPNDLPEYVNTSILRGKSNKPSQHNHVSASYVNAVNGTSISETTLLKHLKRAEDFMLVDVVRVYEALFTGTREECINYISGTKAKKCHIRYSRSLYKQWIEKRNNVMNHISNKKSGKQTNRFAKDKLQPHMNPNNIFQVIRFDPNLICPVK